MQDVQRLCAGSAERQADRHAGGHQAAPRVRARGRQRVERRCVHFSPGLPAGARARAERPSPQCLDYVSSTNRACRLRTSLLSSSLARSLGPCILHSPSLRASLIPPACNPSPCRLIELRISSVAFTPPERGMRDARSARAEGRAERGSAREGRDRMARDGRGCSAGVEWCYWRGAQTTRAERAEVRSRVVPPARARDAERSSLHWLDRDSLKLPLLTHAPFGPPRRVAQGHGVDVALRIRAGERPLAACRDARQAHGVAPRAPASRVDLQDDRDLCPRRRRHLAPRRAGPVALAQADAPRPCVADCERAAPSSFPCCPGSADLPPPPPCACAQPVIGQFAESLNPSMEAYKRCALRAGPLPPPSRLSRASRRGQTITR